MPNSKRKCALKSCSKRQPFETMVIKEPLAWCDIEHQLQYGMENRAKGHRVRAKQDRAERQSFKQRKKMSKQDDLAHQRELTQKQVNKLASALDRGKPCISCSRLHNPTKRRNASHLKSVGSNSFLRYSLVNIHDACINCNLYNSGNIEGYKIGIVARYSQAHLDYLETAPRQKEWTFDELKAIRIEASAEIRRIERGESLTKNWRALPEQEQA